MEWQTVSALIVVGLAGLWLLPRAIGMLRGDRKAGCGHCGGCATDRTKATEKPLVSISKIGDDRH